VCKRGLVWEGRYENRTEQKKASKTLRLQRSTFKEGPFLFLISLFFLCKNKYIRDYRIPTVGACGAVIADGILHDKEELMED
jgi:hypothetical protein